MFCIKKLMARLLLLVCGLGSLACYSDPPPQCHPTDYELCWIENFVEDVKRDYYFYFQKKNLVLLGDFFVTAGILANTGLDRSIATNWQDDIRSSGSDRFFKFWKGAGGLSFYYAPLYLVTMSIGHMREHSAVGNVVYHWAYRSLRTILVGAPQQIFLAHALGSGRPSEHQESKWQPFHDNKAVSGHAFYGAVPFLSAAMMSDPPLLRYGLYILSTLPGLSRINSNAHYTSQVVLGWALAFLSARSVAESDQHRCPLFQIGMHPKSDGAMITARFSF